MIGPRKSGRLGALALVILAVSSITAARAGWSVGVRVGVPIYPHCYGPCIYRPYPYYIRPAPVFVQPVAVVEPAPVYAVPAVAAAAPAASATLPAPTPVTAHSPEAGTRQQDIDHYQQQLLSPEPRERAEALMQLGRLRAANGLGLLTGSLNNDRSPQVREAAARALGLFNSADALPALQRAAQADDDPQVRRRASYAADVIRSNAPRQ